MNRTTKKAGFGLILALLAAVSGYLLSKASLVGRVGISLFYKEYKFLKVWWQGALFVATVWAFIFLLQGWLHRKLHGAQQKAFHLALIVLSLIGLYLTYADFRHTLSHRLLGERFHLGAYLFWIGPILISVYYLTFKKETAVYAEERRDTSVQANG